MRLLKRGFLVLMCLVTVCGGYSPLAADIGAAPVMQRFYVSPDGSDTAPGSENAPFQTIERAQEAVRGINKDMNGDIKVILRGGEYLLSDTLRFNENDGGTNGYFVRYEAYPGETPVISGAKKIEGWTKEAGGLWSAPLTGEEIVPQLYVGEKKARRAQSEDFIDVVRIYDDPGTEYEADGVTVDKKFLKDYKNIDNIQLHFHCAWEDYLMNVTEIRDGKDGEKHLLLEQPMCMMILKPTDVILPVEAGSSFYLENAFEELDVPGEYYYSKEQGKIYYMPRDGEDLTKTPVYMPNLEVITDVRGSDFNHKVKNIVFDGITFCHGKHLLGYLEGMCSVQANYWRRPHDMGTPEPGNTVVPANIQLYATDRIIFRNNHIKFMGGVGLGLYEGCINTEIYGNVFEDIVNSAVTIGLPDYAYLGGETKGRNLAVGNVKTSASSVYPFPSHGTRQSIDKIPFTGWSSYAGDNLPWWQVDLGKSYRIHRIEMDERPNTFDLSTKKNFEIIASNDEDFENYRLLASQGDSPYGKTAVYYVDNEEKFRYVRVRKSTIGAMYINEIRIYNEDMDYIPEREVCKNTLIHDNYVTRIGDGNWAAPGIQYYFTEKTDIVHNEFYDLPYTAICGGWGWHDYPDSTVCRDNNISFNRIDSVQNRLFDGGGIYMLGNQPNSTIIGNFISNVYNVFGAVYLDAAVQYFKVIDNVYESVQLSNFPNSSTRDLNFYNNYSMAIAELHNNENSDIEDIKPYIAGNPPEDALRIMMNSGLRDEYKSIKDKASERYWIYPELTRYENAIHDTTNHIMNDNTFKSRYVKGELSSAQIYLSLAKTGDDIGMYSKKVYDELSAMIDKGYELLGAEETDREKLIEYKLALKAKMQELADSRKCLSFSELTAESEKYLSSAQIGDGKGQYPKEAVETFRKKFEAYRSGRSEYAYLALEKGFETFRNAEIRTDITGFEVPGQLSDAVIDNADKTVKIKMKYVADLNAAPKITVPNGITVTPASGQRVNLENPVTYTLSTKNNDSETWTVTAEREQVINTDSVCYLNDAIADEAGWSTFSGEGGSAAKIYKDGLYGDTELVFDIRIDKAAADWPSVTFRNQSYTEDFAGKNSAAYIFVFTPGNIEFYRYNNGVRTVLCGNFPGLESMVGDVVSTDALKFNEKNRMSITARNEGDGVRIILKINGEEVINLLDNFDGAIKNPGYFGTTSPQLPIKLFAAERND